MKKIYLSLITLVIMFFGIMGVKAETAILTKTYEAGDEVEVVLGKGIKERFYILEDLDDTYVTAIYKDVLGEEISFEPRRNGFEGSLINKKLEELTKDWKAPEEIRLITTDEINRNINIVKEESYEFTKPNHLNIGKSYWTETIIDNDDSFKLYLVKESSTKAILKSDDNEKAYIRPVIKISKGAIEGAIIKPRNLDEFAKNFVNALKTSGFIELEKEISKNYLKFKIYNEDNLIDEVHFDYIDGKLIYKAENDDDTTSSTYKFMVSEMLFIYAFSLEMPNYLYQGFFIEDDIQTVDIDDEYFKVDRVEGDSWPSTSIKEMTINLAKLCDWEIPKEEEKAEEIPKDETKEETTTSKKEEINDEQKVENTKKEEAEKNPKTADTNVILVMLGLIASSSLIVVSKKKLCKK